MGGMQPRSHCRGRRLVFECRHKGREFGDLHRRRNSIAPALFLLGILLVLPRGPTGKPAFAQPTAGQARSSLQVGQNVYCKITDIMDSGVIVLLDGTDIPGFVHKSQLSDEFVKHPSDVRRTGDTVKAMVVRNTPEGLELSIAKANRKPATDFIVGQEVTGNVTKIEPYGAFVDIGAEKDCFLHISQIHVGFVRDVEDYVQVGRTVSARIRKRDDERGRVELSMLPANEVAMPIQDGLKLDALEPGQEMGGVVTGVRRFGCFVDVGAENDGLVHIRNLNGGIVGNIDTLVKAGDKLVVRVLRMNEGKLELELAAPLPRLPPVDGFLEVPEDAWLEGTVEGTVQRGALVEITPPAGGPAVTALLGKRQIDDVSEIYEGNTVKVRIQRVDQEQRQVLVSQLEPTAMPAQKKLTIAELSPGDELAAVCTGVREYGCFVDVGAEAVGMVPIQDINGGIVTDINAIVQIGDELLVRFVGLHKGKPSFELAKPLPRLPSVEPFVALKDEVVEGIVAGKGKSGTFVELTPPGGGPAVTSLMFGLYGGIKIGDQIRVKIFSVDTDRKQVFTSNVKVDGQRKEEAPFGAGGSTSERAARASISGF